MNALSITNKLLDETDKSKQSSVNKINLIQQNIKQRQQLISTINQEISSLDETIDTLKNEKSVLESKLSRAKADYARLTREIHFRQNALSYVTFILSAENFEQMYRRIIYLKQIKDFRVRQAQEIKNTQFEIDEKENVLQQNRERKSEVLAVQKHENRRLESDKEKENRMLSQLKEKEKKLREQQKKQQQMAESLNKKIQNLIAAEIEKERKAKEAAQKNKSQKTLAQSKDDQLIAGNFEKNRGRLPWPVEKGVISGKFGIQPHPVLTHVTTNNKGVYIQTSSGASARAVFEGVVTQCFSIPGSNNAVIIKHGNYRTVYTNLTQLFVKEGEKVSAKQRLGKIFTDEENDNKTEMQLMLYLGTDLQNPEPWLAK